MNLPPETITDWLLRTSLEGSLLILIVLGLRRAFGRHLGPRWRIALWTLVGVKLLMPASLTFLPGIGEWLLPDEIHAVPVVDTAPLESADAATSATVPTFAAASPGEPRAVTEALPASMETTAPISIHTWLITAWLGGAVLLVTMMLFRQWRFAAAAASRPCRDPELRAMLRSAAREVGLRRPVGAVLAPAGTTPAVFGMFQPKVLIPTDWQQRFDAEGLRHVLLHELEHVRFGDVLWNWAAAALNALHWFNPLAWMARSLFQSDRELRCDAGTLARLDSDERIAYGRTLLKVQENFHAAPAIAGLAPCVRHHSTLRQRIAMITHPTTRKSWLNLLLSAAIAALFCFSFGAAQADGEREGARDGERSREGARDGDAPREGARDGERSREGARDGDAPREGARDGERSREGARDGDAPREGARDGERSREGARDGDAPREGARDGDMRRDGDAGADRPGEVRMIVERDGVILGDVKYRSMADFRAALAKLEAKSGSITANGDVPVTTVKAVVDALSDQGINDIRFATSDRRARDGEGSREGARDGEMRRDGDRPREGGARDGEGSREGARDGDRPREGGARDGDRPREGEREGARDGEGARGSSPDMDRRLSQLTRIYGSYDKNSDGKVSFEEWLAMKDGEMPRDRREREKGWFDEADANGDDGLTLEEWQDWKLSQGKPEGAARRDGDAAREGSRDGDRPREGSREGARDGDR